MRYKHLLKCIVVLQVTVAPVHYAFSQNFDKATVQEYTLPDPLIFRDGTKVTTAKEWHKRRRAEIMEIFEREMYGRTPKHPANMRFEVLTMSPMRSMVRQPESRLQFS
jgi:hypothetical protein